jgi:ribosomal protein S14
MLDVDVRRAIFELRRCGHGFRTIARTLMISRKTVRAVVRQGEVEPPGIERDTELDPHIEPKA